VNTTTRARARWITALLALVGILALSACSTSASGKWSDTHGPGGAPIGGGNGHAAGAPTISFPHNKATDVPAGLTIAYATKDNAAATVTLKDDSGDSISGAPGYDPSTWVPDEELKYATHYTATVTAPGANGKPATSSVEFTTMTEPDKTTRVQSFMGDNQVFGIGMPVILTLSHGVSSDDRAAVEKRLSVQSTPAQTGSWNWVNDHEIHYRPEAYWQPGTKLHVDVKTGGVPFGNGYYGLRNLTVDASIATNSLQITTNDKTHMMTVVQNGKVVKTFPVSLGKPSTPSSSGHMIIMTRSTQEIFDSSLGTGGIPVAAPGGYRELVYWTMRLTWGGQFIHAAPWSVKDQGHRDVSHGCTNVSTANAKWIYQNSHIGDPVTVTGTPRKLTWGDGWTDWNVDFATYKKGSALN
jgi:lipoprotein-anchoring transpeptidase ErfK/SrfK